MEKWFVCLSEQVCQTPPTCLPPPSTTLFGVSCWQNVLSCHDIPTASEIDRGLVFVVFAGSERKYHFTELAERVIWQPRCHIIGIEWARLFGAF